MGTDVAGFLWILVRREDEHDMSNVKIYGAGSIGNHLAHAARSLGWSVVVCDVNHEALDRMKSDIYPGRYGQWDSAIGL